MKDVKDEIVALKKKIAKAENKRDKYEEGKGIKSDEYKDAKEEVLRLTTLVVASTNELHDVNTTYNTLLSRQPQQQQQPVSQGTIPIYIFSP